LLYETLEEYGSHLVEAVWAHEVWKKTYDDFLLPPCSQSW
jgi:hypothetical protein